MPAIPGCHLYWIGGELVPPAMLVPQFSSKEGIQYNPEALEIFFDAEALVLTDWMQQLNTQPIAEVDGSGVRL